MQVRAKAQGRLKLWIGEGEYESERRLGLESLYLVLYDSSWQASFLLFVEVLTVDFLSYTLFFFSAILLV